MKKQAQCNITTQCQTRILAIKDAMEILSGKWKFHILGTLLLNEKLRFMDLLREVEGIAPKMLSKELQDMEMNQLITRTIVHTKPITVEYALTEAGKTVGPLIDELASWGTAYRNALFHQ
ncbi:MULTISPECIES: winged helix-turn-helix transcriptional regulator [Edaphocola]|jgi:DNA-binding HxlR family transcriptional regulator|uniref:winged helix-turn-helix transcriptional regulator n=1 Tax=Edaphocola TaxID=2601681 RepID=UPI000FB617D9|nr:MULTISPECIES: helix-turn-helix domain-containing protein [Edaphocola]